MTDLLTNFPFVHKPYDLQYKIWDRSKEEAYFALLMEMGTGKSKITIDTMAYLWLSNQIDIVLIFAKKGEYSNWVDVELPIHMPKEVPYEAITYSAGMKAWPKQQLRNLMSPSNKLRIVVINVESMRMGADGEEHSEAYKVAKFFIKSRRKGLMLIVDESTCVKNTDAKRSKAIYSLVPFARFRRILTGTPITNSPLDIWGQSLILGKGVLGEESFYSFKGNHTETEKNWVMRNGKPQSYKTVTGFKNLDKLQAKIKTFGVIVERKDFLDLPDKIYKKVSVPLTEKQEFYYNEMRDKAMLELGDGEIIEATNALSIITRLDQIACGQLKKEDGTFEIIESNRPEALITQIESSEKKGIIWCNYRGLCDYLFEYMKETYGGEKYVGRYYGGVKDDERALTITRFQDPTNSLFWIVANQQSLGYGRTLTVGKNNYYYSNGYNLEHRLQSEDRTMRIGQDESVLYTDFFSKGTVNERVLEVLRTKKNLAHLVLGTRITDWI